MEFLVALKKISVGIGVLGSTMIIPILASDGKTIPNNTKEIEIEINIKNNNNTTTEKLRAPIDNISNINKFQYEKDNNGTKTFENIDKSEKSDKYKNLSNLAYKFLKIQHNLNLIKSKRGLQKEDKNFKDLCAKCCKPNGNDCEMCFCCKENCSSNQNDNCCCKDDAKTQCKGTITESSLTNFFVRINNLDSAITNQYLSPMKIIMTIDTTDKDKIEEGSVGGSVIYGFVNYKYDKLDSIQNNESLIKSITKTSNTSNTDKFFANIPQKYEFKKDASQNGNNIQKILDQLEKKEEIQKLMDTTSTSDTCNCCSTQTIIF